MSDLIERQAAIDALEIPKVIDLYDHYWNGRNDQYKKDVDAIADLPATQHNTDYSDGYADGYKQGTKDAQPEIIRCKDCVYYDPPHVENNGVRSEYSEMPEDAFDVLGVGLVSAEYGINIGGRCCRDYNVSYSEDKRVFIPETNYCGRAERRTDE